jgi:uncharacterized Zn-binding protein involved in type VI secretion
MPFAARVGDMTSHGKPLGAPGIGSTNVLIGGKPAWRVLVDATTCPLTDPKPHGGGSVAKGSTSVLINLAPAVRMGDVVVEVGPPNAITSGCLTVSIGG